MSKKEILEKINSPNDLKNLNLSELKTLAAEIREFLIENISKTGGHLASNLGVVELTLALHRVFNSPEDKIIWDVGHQCYTHKLVTGRKNRFATIRQYQGLSGYPVRQESPHDQFGVGHAGTSLSAALGMALARDLNNQNYQVVAVIGDGSLVTGMALEAINHISHLGQKVIIILNDNGMSISPSVGIVAQILNRIRFSRQWEIFKKELKEKIIRLPAGERFWDKLKRVKNIIGNLLLADTFWRQIGFVYLGPIDGHDIVQLEKAFIRARDFETKPTFIHVLTTKGKGYFLAETDPVKFHSISPAESKKSNIPTYSQIFAQTVRRLMRENKKIVVITPAMLEGSGLSAIRHEFPDRIFDVGICEQHAVTLSAGLASQGFIPIVAIYSTFLQRAYDQLIHDVCLQKLPVVFTIDRAGIVGDDGPTHQGIFDFSYLRCIPNIILASPKDEDELQHLLFTAIKIEQPIAIRYPRGQGQGVPLNPDFHHLPIGKAEILREGKKITLLAIGSTVYPALSATEQFIKEGIDCGLINVRFLKPLDSDLILDQVSKTKRLLTIEENVFSGGFHSAILELFSKARMEGVKTLSLSLPDKFIEQGPQGILRSKFGLDDRGIIETIKTSFPEIVS